MKKDNFPKRVGWQSDPLLFLYNLMSDSMNQFGICVEFAAGNVRIIDRKALQVYNFYNDDFRSAYGQVKEMV